VISENIQGGNVPRIKTDALSTGMNLFELF
jgi:hypothetical protein